MIDWLNRFLRRGAPTAGPILTMYTPPPCATLYGIPSESRPTDGRLVFERDQEGAWRPNRNDLIYEIEHYCVYIHDYLADVIFGGLQTYYQVLPTLPSFLSETGLNSESPLSRNDFERLVKGLTATPYINQVLYLYDCRKLVSGIQECMKELAFLMGEFYRALNFDELFYPTVPEEDGVRFISSPATTAITAVLNFIFIRMHSLMDYTTKLIFEVRDLKLTFDRYPRLSSSTIQFGDHKQLAIQHSQGTFFEGCELIATIETVRNFIIHDGLLDDMPKVYKVVKKGVAIEKFILFPDMKDGRLLKFNNRRTFFASEDKIICAFRNWWPSSKRVS